MDDADLLEEIEDELASFKRETKYKQLPLDRYIELRQQYERTPLVTSVCGDIQFYPAGEHVVLRSILNRFGYYPNNREETMKIAHDLILLGANYV